MLGPLTQLEAAAAAAFPEYGHDPNLTLPHTHTLPLSPYPYA